jgi:hypothetical protein
MKQVFLKSLPDGPKHAGQVVPENFGVREVEINEIGADGGFKQSELKTDQVIVRIKCLSVMVKFIFET